jgi:hypothetical protein
MKRINSYYPFLTASTCRSESCSLQQQPLAAPFYPRVQLVLKTSMDQEKIYTRKIYLAGEACNVFGTDLPDLKLEVEYQTSERLHVKIKDSNNTVYQASTAIVTKRTVANCRPGPR